MRPVFLHEEKNIVFNVEHISNIHGFAGILFHKEELQINTYDLLNPKWITGDHSKIWMSRESKDFQVEKKDLNK